MVDIMVHYLRLNKEPFDLIKSGAKTIEMRLYDEKRQQIKVGDNIVFSLRENEEVKISTKVVSLSIFKSFEELYSNFDKRVLGYKENESARYTDMEEFYSKEEQSMYGVVAIGVEVC